MNPLLFDGRAAACQQKTNAIVCNDCQLRLTQNIKKAKTIQYPLIPISIPITNTYKLFTSNLALHSHFHIKTTFKCIQ